MEILLIRKHYYSIYQLYNQVKTQAPVGVAAVTPTRRGLRVTLCQ